MDSKYGFTRMTPSEFENWIKTRQGARTVLYVQEHHTYIPAYSHFNGSNHFELQLSMLRTHTSINGWVDIGQHFSIFPDGMIVTGRSLERSPACIFGFNAHSICIENVGNFDRDGDIMRQEQRQAVVQVTAALCKRYGIPINTSRIVYHHWFDLSTGERRNGDGITKSCPGTGFFGGNKETDANANFLPLVRTAAGGDIRVTPLGVAFYGYVTPSWLNVRKGPGTSHSIINKVQMGAVLRIYEVRNGWYRISRSNQEWVAGNFVARVERGTVHVDSLNVRSGPSTAFPVVNRLRRGDEIFVYEQSDTWVRISLDNQWVSRLVNFGG